MTLIYMAQDYDLTLHPLKGTGGPLPNYHEKRLLSGLRKLASNPTKSLVQQCFLTILGRTSTIRTIVILTH